MSVYSHPLARAMPQAVRQLARFALVCTVAFLVDLTSDAAVRDFVRSRPFVAFRPARSDPA
jgi:hypothetical protein